MHKLKITISILSKLKTRVLYKIFLTINNKQTNKNYKTKSIDNMNNHGQK